MKRCLWWNWKQNPGILTPSPPNSGQCLLAYKWGRHTLNKHFLCCYPTYIEHSEILNNLSKIWVHSLKTNIPHSVTGNQLHNFQDLSNAFSTCQINTYLLKQLRVLKASQRVNTFERKKIPNSFLHLLKFTAVLWHFQ